MNYFDVSKILILLSEFRKIANNEFIIGAQGQIKNLRGIRSAEI